MVPEHQADQDDERDKKVDKTYDNGTDRNQHPREIDLREQVGIFYEGIAAFRHRIGKKLPWKHGRIYHHWVWNSVRREFSKTSENNCKHDHGQERAQDAPDYSDNGLLVANEYVAPGKEIKQFTVAPQIAPISYYAFARFQNDIVFPMKIGHSLRPVQTIYIIFGHGFIWSS